MTYNVLYINSISEMAGAEVSLIALLRSLDRDTFYPIVVLPHQGPLVDRLRSTGIETIVVPLHKLSKKNPLSIVPYLQTVYCLTKIIKRYEIRLVHINMFNANQYGAVAAWMMKTPSICHIRNLIDKPCFDLEFLFLTPTLIANSKATETSYKLFLKSWQRSVVVYNSVDLYSFEAGERTNSFRMGYGIDRDAFLIGCVGQIDPTKGQSILIEAIGQLINSYSQIRVFLAGDVSVSHAAQYLDDLKLLSVRLGLTEKVVFGGFIEDVVPMYTSFDLLVLPSTYEPFGRVLIEAMALRKPVVATKIQGIVEVVKDGVTGLLVQPNDPVALAKAIARVIVDPSLARRLGENGRERAKKLFDAATNARLMEEIYWQVLNNEINREDSYIKTANN